MNQNTLDPRVEKAARIVRLLYIVLIPLVLIGIYFAPMERRPMQEDFGRIVFYGLLAASALDVVLMRVVASSGMKRVREERTSTEWPASAAGLVYAVGLNGLSPLGFALIYYVMGGSIDRSLIIAGFAILAHFNFLSLIPQLGGSEGS